MNATYDVIGVNYADLRKPDPRIAAMIEDALGDADKVLNVGAGAGSYEPAGRRITALEPSLEMINQRKSPVEKVVQGVAEDLPFVDDSFDAVMGVLTIHHWTDQAKGLQEMRRVSKGPVVLLTFDPAIRDFWLGEYFPELISLDDEKMPPLDMYGQHFGSVDILPVPIPHDCQDGFLYAYWRRPEAYLDQRIRNAMSSFWKLGDISDGLAKLQQDLESGAWLQRYGHLMDLDNYDGGYRLVVAR